MSSLDNQWVQLCEEWNEANEKFVGSFTRLNKHFVALANGTSATNSTLKELDEQAEAWERFEDITRRMSDFVRKNS